MSQSANAPFFVDNEVIVLNRNGVWIADDTEITHEPTRKLFARSIKKREDGYYLEIGRESKKIIIEDTPYFVMRIDGNLKTGFELTLNDETHEPLNSETLSYQPGRLTCLLKNGFEAKFLSAPYIDLLKHLEENDSNYYLPFQPQPISISKK